MKCNHRLFDYYKPHEKRYLGIKGSVHATFILREKSYKTALQKDHNLIKVSSFSSPFLPQFHLKTCESSQRCLSGEPSPCTCRSLNQAQVTCQWPRWLQQPQSCSLSLQTSLFLAIHPNSWSGLQSCPSPCFKPFQDHSLLLPGSAHSQPWSSSPCQHLSLDLPLATQPTFTLQPAEFHSSFPLPPSSPHLFLASYAWILPAWSH